jgi:hypothetical protein
MTVTTGKGRFLWAIGGKIENAHTVDDTTVYSVNEDRWYSSVNGDLAPMPHAVQGAGWALYDGRIYCFGGKTEAHSGCSAFVQVYDIDTDQWTVLNEMPAARSKLGKFYPVVEDRYVFLFGGDDAGGRFHRVNWNWRYDLQTGSWDTDIAGAPFSQSFPCPTTHGGWLYYSTGNTQCKGPLNDYPGALSQRYNPRTDEWQVMAPCPHPVTDGSGDIWQGELHFVGGWNTNRTFYSEGCDHYVGPVKKLHVVYNYRANAWRYAPELPDHWHHGGVRSDGEHLWRYLGTTDEEAGEGEGQHTNRLFRWDGETWTEMAPAPVRKMNFGTLYSNLGPVAE